ncbi:MAG TPA: (Fe-S)-binding protein, partial [Nitriliruptorales bacterium]|nr:(Fe-S)-binding protein [Nitriliruptorales bacterium]
VRRRRSPEVVQGRAAAALGDHPVGADTRGGQQTVGRDEPAVLAAADRLLAAAGVRADWVIPQGCCGATLHDLGAAAAAHERQSALQSRLADGDGPVLATDPHCLSALRAALVDRPVDALVAHLADLAERGRLPLGGAPTVAYHDPCVLARDEHVWAAPRRLLAVAGAGPAEPEGSGGTTVCSGAGMAFDLVDPTTASAVAARRAGQLAAVGAPVVTACARARQRLEAGGLPVQDLFGFLASHLVAGQGAS